MISDSRTINIVMSADNNNKIQLLVSVFSVVKNKNADTKYKFYFLLTDDFDLKIVEAINNILLDYGLNRASILNMGSLFENAPINKEGITVPTYYRLKLPELLNTDKCIYLDVDVIVLSDLCKLYNQIKDDYMISGVKAAIYYWPPDSYKSKAEYLNIQAFDSYINAGVMVMNLSLMRKLNISETFEKLLKLSFADQDQDIINSACYGYINIIPPKYNSMTKYWNDDFKNYYNDNFPYLKQCYSLEEWKEACEHPVIIHYADKYKPWNTVGVSFLSLWWDYLKEVDDYYSCYEELRSQFIKKQILAVRTNNYLLDTLNEELSNIKNSKTYLFAKLIAYPIKAVKKLFRK